MATNTSDFFTFSKTAGTAKNLQKPTDGGDNNLWGGYINVDLDTIVGAVNATSDLIADANQNELVDFTATGSAVNHVGITNAATGNGPTIEAKGDDTNIDLNVSGKGTGALASTGAKLTSPKVITGVNDTNGNELVKVTATGSAVNEITVANAATGNGPTLSATGDDTNIDLNIEGKGTGEIKLGSNINFLNDTDAKIKLPSAGGIFESNGSAEILTESSGTVSLKNTTLNANNVFPAGHVLQVVSSGATATASTTTAGDVVNSGVELTIGTGNKAYINVTGWMYTTISSATVDRVVSIYKEVSGSDTIIQTNQPGAWGETEPQFARSAISGSFLDNTTGTVRYKLKVSSTGSAGTIHYYTIVTVFEVKG